MNFNQYHDIIMCSVTERLLILNNSIAKEVMTGPSHDLLESTAEEISSKIMIHYDRVTAVRVKVAKPDVVVGGPIDYLGVEIFRSRDRDMSI